MNGIAGGKFTWKGQSGKEGPTDAVESERVEGAEGERKQIQTEPEVVAKSGRYIRRRKQ